MVGTVPSLGALAYKDKSRFTADLIVAKSGTRDYSNVFDAVDAGNEGDKIYIKKGTYEEEDVAIKDNMELVGIYGATILKLPNSSDATYGIITNADGVNGNENFIIRNLVLDGNKANQPLLFISTIYIRRSTNARFEKLIVKNSKQYGIHTYAFNEKVHIKNCISYGHRLAGIKIHHNVNRCILEQNYCYLNGQEGIFFNGEANSKWNKILNNWCYNNSQTVGGAKDGISIVDAWDVCNETLVIGNHCFDNQGTKTQRYGINEGETTNYSLITNNDCRTNQHATYDIVSVGANSKVCNNMGRYVAKGCD